MLLQAGLVFGQAAPSDSMGTTKSIVSCWTKVSRLGHGKEIILYDHAGVRHEGNVENVRDDPPVLSMKEYDSSQSRFFTRDFSPGAVKRVEYRSSDVFLPIAGALILGGLGFTAGRAWDDDPDNGGTKHAALGGAIFDVLIGGGLGLLFTPTSHHVIECP